MIFSLPHQKAERWGRKVIGRLNGSGRRSEGTYLKKEVKVGLVGADPEKGIRT
jgi:hypothetical protein